MHWLRLRPTFVLHLQVTRAEAIESLRLECEREGKRESFSMFGEYGELHLPAEVHRLWSPHLSFYVAEDGAASLIHGRFAPRLEVWTFVWIIYLAMAFSAFFGLTLAYSQWMLGETVWGLGVAVGGLLLIMGLYVVAGIGQALSTDQMTLLRTRLETILQSAELECHDLECSLLAVEG